MNDEQHKKKGNDGGAGAFLPLGIVFLAVGTGMGLSQDNWAMAVPFLVLGGAFLIVALQKLGKNKTKEE